MPVQQPVLEAGTQVSRYRVERLVARGGMGLVYRARDVRLDRPVALKLLSPELSDDERFRERFVRESRLAAAVDHPNVIPVYEADDWDGMLYLAMRFVDGVDLHTVLATAGRMDPATTLPVLAQAADALDAAHRQGLVHRDVKPGNFMLAGATATNLPANTHVYLTDFGLTKRASSVSGLTRTGQFLGSLHYVAPEQIQGEEVDARTDVYALACVAFEMLAGRPPFDIEGEAGLLWAHMATPPPSLAVHRPDLPAAVDAAVAQGMAKQRTERPASCGEFFTELQTALAGVPGVGSGRAAPTQMSGSAGASTAPRRHGEHPSFPPAEPLGAIPPPREPTSVQPPAGWAAASAGWSPAPPAALGGLPPGGPGVPAGPVGPGGPGPVGGTSAPRRRRTALLVALPAVLVLVAGALLVWSPWSGPDLTPRDLVVVPYRAAVPEDWQTTTETESRVFSVLGSRDWSGLITGDADTLSSAESAAKDDPESLVYLYVDASEGVYADTADDAAAQLTGALPSGTRLVPQGEREVAGRAAVEVGGVVPLGDSAQLRLYAVAVKEEPRALLIFSCPPALYDEWRPTFDAIVDSVTFTG